MFKRSSTSLNSLLTSVSKKPLAVLDLRCRKEKLVILYNIISLPSSCIDRSASSFYFPTAMPSYLVSNIQTSHSVGLGVRPTHL